MKFDKRYLVAPAVMVVAAVCIVVIAALAGGVIQAVGETAHDTVSEMTAPLVNTQTVTEDLERSGVVNGMTVRHTAHIESTYRWVSGSGSYALILSDAVSEVGFHE